MAPLCRPQPCGGSSDPDRINATTLRGGRVRRSGGGSRDRTWFAYPETILVFAGERHTLALDLRRPLGELDREALAALRMPAPFGVVTAANPIGGELSHAENQSRHEALRTRLESSGLRRRLAADGVSSDGSHREAGFAIHASRDEIRRLANEFEQSAFFWFDGSAFWLVDATDDSYEIRLPPDER